jgi:putative hemolysin
MNVQLHIIGILLGFIGSAFFSGLEIGVFSVRRARLLHYVRDGLRAALQLEHYLRNSQRFLGSILVGNNLCNVLLSTLSAALAKTFFAQNSFLQSFWALLMATMVLIFCEFLPKMVFESRPLRRTLPLVSIFSLIDKVLSPVTDMVLFCTQWVIPKSSRKSESRFVITREFLHDVVTDRERGAQITAIERLMIKRVLALQSLTALQIMTPLSKVSRVSEKTSLQQCYEVVRHSGHVRLPVFSEDGSRCVGVLHALDVLSFMPDPMATPASAYVQPPCYVPCNMRADDLLPLMRRNRQPMVFVRNRQGRVAGIVTEADILNRLTVNLVVG